MDLNFNFSFGPGQAQAKILFLYFRLGRAEIVAMQAGPGLKNPGLLFCPLFCKKSRTPDEMNEIGQSGQNENTLILNLFDIYHCYVVLHFLLRMKLYFKN